MDANSKIKALVAATPQVHKPSLFGGRWAQKRVYTGTLLSTFVNCSKNARPGMLTCSWHKHFPFG